HRDRHVVESRSRPDEQHRDGFLQRREPDSRALAVRTAAHRARTRHRRSLRDEASRMTEAPLETKSSARTAIKVAVALIVIGGFAALWFSPLRTYLTREHIRVMAESVRGVWYAPLLLIVAYAVGCIFAIPASFFILAAGVIWGWKLGGTYALIGGVI